jgi:hypothetical protein
MGVRRTHWSVSRRREPQSARGIKKSRRPDARGPRRNLETERSSYESRNQADRARKWYRYHKAQAHRHRVLSDALVARHEKEGPALHGPWAPKMTGYRWQHR